MDNEKELHFFESPVPMKFDINSDKKMQEDEHITINTQ
jgi:hypothetical protein